MAKNQKDFFDELKPWSKIKNDLLATYLLPYFSKITNTKRNTFYVDCFAGQGRFKDGNDGSPFLAVRTREHALKAKENAHGNIELAFIFENDLLPLDWPRFRQDVLDLFSEAGKREASDYYIKQDLRAAR